jgi:hypothetical protein
LLDKYFEGETSLEEESQLKAYFNGSAVASGLEAFRPLFQFFEAEKEASLSDDFEHKLLRKIQERPARRIRLFTPYIMRVAAAAAVLFGIVALFPNQQHSHGAVAINWEQFEPQTEEEALAEATAALELLASKLNGGAKKASKEIHKIEKTSEIFK